MLGKLRAAWLAHDSAFCFQVGENGVKNLSLHLTKKLLKFAQGHESAQRPAAVIIAEGFDDQPANF